MIYSWFECGDRFMDKDPLDYFQQAKKEHARLKLELTADLSPLFHWNCKQLYVWLQMEYENDRYVCVYTVQI